mmetsp:Transcript_24947/g.37298  ORF Transcript_24947/g.37298 Transcript_24947/m.37298 type:complete len:253 (+) Transcript_24947:681-1439(+)
MPSPHRPHPKPHPWARGSTTLDRSTSRRTRSITALERGWSTFYRSVSHHCYRQCQSQKLKRKRKPWRGIIFLERSLCGIGLHNLMKFCSWRQRHRFFTSTNIQVMLLVLFQSMPFPIFFWAVAIQAPMQIIQLQVLVQVQIITMTIAIAMAMAVTMTLMISCITMKWELVQKLSKLVLMPISALITLIIPTPASPSTKSIATAVVRATTMITTITLQPHPTNTPKSFKLETAKGRSKRRKVKYRGNTETQVG